MTPFTSVTPAENYQTIRPLGHGGMGEVFEAVDRTSGAHVALKRFSAHGKHADFLLNRFRSESRLLKELDHPGLVKVFDAGIGEDSVPYFAMELVSGPSGSPCTLDTLRKEGLDSARIAQIYAELRSVILYLHSKGIVHRDIKLENVLIDADGHARLADFGIARIFNPDLKRQLELSTTTFVGSHQPIIGSGAYLAPEVREGAAATPASDIWALGVLVFRLLTGVWYEPDSSAHDLLAGFEPEWTSLLDTLLAPAPSQRALPPLSPPRKRFRRTGGVLVLLSILLTAGGAFVFHRWRQETTPGRPAPTQPVRAIPLHPRTFTLAPNIELTLLPCPAGTFLMGSCDDPQSPEYQHRVTLTKPFWLGKTQVTRGQWQVYSPGTIRTDEKKEMLGGLNAAMNDISAQEAQSFCRWLTSRHAYKIPPGYQFRLPTEAEWEYALNANCTEANNPYVLWRNGDKSVEAAIMVTRSDYLQANTNSLDLGKWYFLPPMTVATKRPNAWGFYDMLSNGREFVADTLAMTNWTSKHPDDSLGGKGLLLYRQSETDPVRVAFAPSSDTYQSYLKSVLLRGGDQIHGSWHGKLRGRTDWRWGMKATFRVCLGPTLPEQTRY